MNPNRPAVLALRQLDEARIRLTSRRRWFWGWLVSFPVSLGLTIYVIYLLNVVIPNVETPARRMCDVLVFGSMMWTVVSVFGVFCSLATVTYAKAEVRQADYKYQDALEGIVDEEDR